MNIELHVFKIEDDIMIVSDSEVVGSSIQNFEVTTEGLTISGFYAGSSEPVLTRTSAGVYSLANASSVFDLNITGLPADTLNEGNLQVTLLGKSRYFTFNAFTPIPGDDLNENAIGVSFRCVPDGTDTVLTFGLSPFGTGAYALAL